MLIGFYDIYDRFSRKVQVLAGSFVRLSVLVLSWSFVRVFKVPVQVFSVWVSGFRFRVLGA